MALASHTAEYDVTERVAYLDARPPQGRTLHGHSLARWQDGALIVETSNFTENAIGVTNGLGLRAPRSVSSNASRWPPTHYRCSTASS